MYIPKRSRILFTIILCSIVVVVLVNFLCSIYACRGSTIKMDDVISNNPFPVADQKLNKYLSYYNNSKHARKKCLKWIMLAGDSNMRIVFHELLRSYRASSGNKYGETIGGITSNLDSVGEKRRFDRDVIFYFVDGKCVRISLRYMHRSFLEVIRLIHSWSNIRHCKRDCSRSIKPSRQRREFSQDGSPDILFYSHGFWPLLNSITDENACSKEYALVASVLRLFNTEVKVVWMSNPAIYSHPILTDKHIRHDVRCQMKSAGLQNITMFNLYHFVIEKKLKKTVVNDIHISLYTAKYITKIIWNMFS